MAARIGPVRRDRVASEARLQALDALELAENADPREAQALAVCALAAARAGGDSDAEALALRAAGVAALEMGDLVAAERSLRSSIRVARRGGHAERVAHAQRGLARVLAERGDVRGALRELHAAEPCLRGVELGRLMMMRALVDERLGDLGGALEGYDRAQAIFRSAGDGIRTAQTLANRGLLHTLRGSSAAAERDLRAAIERFAAAGMTAAVAKTTQNLALALAVAGRTPDALTLIDQSARDLAALGLRTDHATALRDRAEILLAVRLTGDAVAAAAEASRELAAVGSLSELAEARIVLSECLIADGRPEEAVAIAVEARAALARQARPGWAAVARLVESRARFATGLRDARLLATARAARVELEEAGMATEAVEAGLIAGRVALSLSRHAIAEVELARSARMRRRGPAETRRNAWLAEGFRRLGAGDPRGCMSALRAGLRVLEEQRLLLGASELRASSAAAGHELAALGLRLALERGRPAEAFVWAEAWRARGLSFPPVSPPADPELALALTELRAAMASQESALSDGRSIAGAAGRRAAAEQMIRERMLRIAGGPGRTLATPGVREVRELLSGRVLLEFARSDDRLIAIVISERRLVLRDLGDAEQVVRDAAALAFAVRRVAMGAARPQLAAAASDQGRGLLAGLSAALIEPVLAEIGGGPVVIVPSGDLHGVPWVALPALAGRPVVVCPSAALWMRAARDERPRAGGRLLVSGPGLPGGAGEVRRLARLYPDARQLVGGRARCAEVLGALDDARLAHVTAHGQARGDNPLFSSLALADGLLTVYELEGLRRAPELLVLASCDAAIPNVRAGDEAQGLAAALLGLGTRTLVTAIGLVPDAASADLMVAFHHRLIAGAGPAEALADAVASLDEHDPSALAARTAFVCLGADSA